jgi:uncharacterized damage-inducible protein DinB
MEFKVIWFDRKFNFMTEPEQFPAVVERLRATPPALEELVRDIPREKLTYKPGDKWSIQENVGHLITTERLTTGRIDDFLLGKEQLRPADVTNKLTYDANFNDRTIGSLLEEFRVMRTGALVKCDNVSESDVTRTALHPRLNQPMRLIDHVYFMAEHDAHHLAVITRLLRKQG